MVRPHGSPNSRKRNYCIIRVDRNREYFEQTLKPELDALCDELGRTLSPGPSVCVPLWRLFFFFVETPLSGFLPPRGRFGYRR